MRRLLVAVPEPDEDRDERRRQAGLDEDVEQELRQAERRVVGVELGAGAERAGEDPIPHEPHDVAREDEDREDGRPARDETGRGSAGAANQPRHADASAAGDGAGMRGSLARADQAESPPVAGRRSVAAASTASRMAGNSSMSALNSR